MDLEKIDIHELLPQQEPFVMVERLVSFTMEKTVTRTMIRDDNMMVSDGRLGSSGIIENIAQTCAARIGYINKYILKRGIQLGFIGAIRNLMIYRCPRVGEDIETEIETLEEIFGMTLVKATVRVGEELLAESQMKIAISEEDSRSGVNRFY